MPRRIHAGTADAAPSTGRSSTFTSPRSGAGAKAAIFIRVLFPRPESAVSPVSSRPERRAIHLARVGLRFPGR
jgi:hypothetical protein